MLPASRFSLFSHNHIRNVTAELLSQVTKNVKIQPVLQSLIGETFDEWRANTSDSSRLDIRTKGFWTNHQMALFNVRVFDTNTKRYGAQSSQRFLYEQRKEKKRLYNMRVLQVENGSFTPLVFSINDGMGRETSKCYSQIAEMLSKKSDENYSITMSCIRRKLSFFLMVN